MFKCWIRLSRTVAVVLTALLVAIGCTTPTPEPTATPAPPTPTPVPPTATPTPTNTPIPEPRIANLLFATAEGMANAAKSDVTFDAGPESVYVSFEHADIPTDSHLQLEVRRDGLRVIEREVEWTQGVTGTTTQLISDDPHLLTPGTYSVEVALAGQLLTGRFRISAKQGKPGARLIVDDLDDNLSNWSEYSGDDSWVRVKDGALYLSGKAANYLSWSSLPFLFEDFDLSVDAWQESGPADAYYGVVFRDGPLGNYLFTVTVDGYFEVAVSTGNGYQSLVAYRRSSAAKRGGEVNRLRVVAQGSNFAFYINDQQVAAISDKALKSGSVGLAAGNFDAPGMLAAFDNVVMTLPSEAVEVAPTPAVTPGPRPTPKPTTPPVPPLLTTITQIRTRVDNIGGAIDRLYHGSGVEACEPLLADYYAVVNAPVYDVSGQPSNVQGAYGMYRQAVTIVAEKIAKIRDICEAGGGSMSDLDFAISRTSIADASNLMGTAIGLLQTP